jgi:hypothetical protein
MRQRRRARLILAVMIAVGASAAAAEAQTPQLEAAVKAAYLAKFGAYVAWPAGVLSGDAGPLNLCVVGRDPFGAVLDKSLFGQRIDRHPVIVRRLPAGAAGGSCHIAYFGGMPGAEVGPALQRFDDAPVLTITDANASPVRGIVHFAVVNGRVRFHIDEASAARHSIAISSKLLSLALSVKQRGSP